jgi:hypothetical protein
MEVFAGTLDATGTALTGAQQMRHLFVEQRAPAGVEENELTLTFKGPRMGMASWLANSGSAGAADYLSSSSVLAVFASTREPRQLFDELMAQLVKADPVFGAEFAQAEGKLGIRFADDLAAALGTESAFSLEGVSVTGPVWVLAALVNNPTALDGAIRKLVDVYNAEVPASEQEKRIRLSQETVDGKTWTTMKWGWSPISATWTCDQGYLVAASDRGAGARAIATRNGGALLVRSPEFLQQLPASADLHPSGFAWLNTRGAFQSFASLAPNPAIEKLMAQTDPVLVVFDGANEQMHASSRTRVSGLLLNVMMMESLSRAN